MQSNAIFRRVLAGKYGVVKRRDSNRAEPARARGVSTALVKSSLMARSSAPSGEQGLLDTVDSRDRTVEYEHGREAAEH